MTDKTEYIGYEITYGDRYYRGVVRAKNWNRRCKAYKHPTHGDMPAIPHYMGSGFDLRRAILEHGVEAFERRILARFDNPQEADAWERDNVVMNDDDPLSYNINGGGKSGYKVGKATRARMSDAKKGKPFSETHRQALSKAAQGNTNAACGEYKHGKDARNYKHGRYCKPAPIQVI